MLMSFMRTWSFDFFGLLCENKNGTGHIPVQVMGIYLSVNTAKYRIRFCD